VLANAADGTPEQCDSGWRIHGTNVTGCDPISCHFSVGWTCRQDPLGVVPTSATLVCSCANVAGTYANETLGCAPFACPFPARCLGNGTTCISGAVSTACSLCAKRYYRFNDDCRPCPNGIPIGLVLLLIGAGAFFLYIGPKIAKMTTPQAQGASASDLRSSGCSARCCIA